MQTERGEIPLIRWTDNSFPFFYTLLQRCQEISARFKRFDDNGTLKYLKASHQNNYPVICVAAYKGGSCLPDGLLVTVKPGTDPNQTLTRILDRCVWAANGAVKLSSGNDGLISEVDGATYFNLEGFLDWSNSSASQ